MISAILMPFACIAQVGVSAFAFHYLQFFSVRDLILLPNSFLIAILDMNVHVTFLDFEVLEHMKHDF